MTYLVDVYLGGTLNAKHLLHPVRLHTVADPQEHGQTVL